MQPLDRSFGREAFGGDPAAYHAARPAYPQAVYAALRERAGLAAGIDIREIGAGPGTATLPLLAHDPARLVAVEPDARLAGFLRAAAADLRLQVVVAPFESAGLEPGVFDLAACATAFHWLDAATALARIHDLLRPQGALALWWNVFGDDSRPDPFHEATRALNAGQRPSPTNGAPGAPPYALDVAARLAELATAGFVADRPQFLRWTLTLDAAGVRALYGTYSNVNALDAEARARHLDAIADIAEREFAGRVERNMVTAIYTARRSLRLS